MDQPTLRRTIARDARIELHDTIVQREPGRRPIVGCPATRRYLEITEHGVQAIEALRRHGTIAGAERALRNGAGEGPELNDFVLMLLQRDIVRSIDGEDQTEAADARVRHPLLHKLRPEQLTWLRSPWLLVPVFATVLAWLALLVTRPEYLPHGHDMLLTDRPGLNMVLMFGGLLFMAYLHELAHFFMARSYGIDATISFSHRFYMLVLHTDVTNAWTLPRRPRLAIFLAGMTFNLFVAGAVTLLVAAGPAWLSDGGARFLRYVVMLNTFPLVFQLFIFARTDLYHAALVLTGERNLARDSVSFLFYRVRRRLRLLLRRGRGRCAECPGTVQEQDPFCFRCGATREVATEGILPFEYRSRNILTAWGIVQSVGTAFGILFILLLGVPAITLNLLYALSLLGDQSDVLGLAEAVLAVALIALQLGFIAWLMGRTALRLVSRAFRFLFSGVARFLLARLSARRLQDLSNYAITLAYPALQAKGLVPSPEQRRAQVMAAYEAMQRAEATPQATGHEAATAPAVRSADRSPT